MDKRKIKLRIERSGKRHIIVSDNFHIIFGWDGDDEDVTAIVSAEDLGSAIRRNITITLKRGEYGIELKPGLFEHDIVVFDDQNGNTGLKGEVIFDRENVVAYVITSDAKIPLYRIARYETIGSTLEGDNLLLSNDENKEHDKANEFDKKKKFTIYSDGSCLSNPGPCGAGYLVLDENGVLLHKESISIGVGTNNIGELTGINEALKYVVKELLPDAKEISLFSDSEYAVKGINIWSDKWKKNGWKTASGDPVRNEELWRSIRELKDIIAKETKINIKWVKGHSDNHWNEEADALAVNGANAALTSKVG